MAMLQRLDKLDEIFTENEQVGYKYYTHLSFL